MLVTFVYLVWCIIYESNAEQRISELQNLATPRIIECESNANHVTSVFQLARKLNQADLPPLLKSLADIWHTLLCNASGRMTEQPAHNRHFHSVIQSHHCKRVSQAMHSKWMGES